MIVIAEYVEKEDHDQDEKGDGEDKNQQDQMREIR